MRGMTKTNWNPDNLKRALRSLDQKALLDVLDEVLTDRAALFVSHDLAVVREVCRHIIVMQEGRIVEAGEVDDVIASPAHPYTASLVEAAKGEL